MKKFLAVTICFFLFFAVFAIFICFDSYNAQVTNSNIVTKLTKDSIEREHYCLDEYSFQESKIERSSFAIFTESDSTRQSFKFLNPFSLFASNLSNLYLAKAQFPDSDMISNFRQKSNQVNHLLAMVKIE